MMSTFDPYRDWLGIQQATRPLNHYELLGVPLFTKDTDVISRAADQQIAKLRPHATGANVEIAQRVAKEIVGARKLLLSAEWRKAYDLSLKKQQGHAAGASGIGAATPQKPKTAPSAGASGIGARGPKPVQPQMQPQPAMPIHPQSPVPAQMPPQAIPVQAVPAHPQSLPPGAMPMGQPVYAAPMYAQPPQSEILSVGPSSVKRYARRRQSSSMGAAIALLLLAVVALGGFLAYVNRDKLLGKTGTDEPTSSGTTANPTQTQTSEEPVPASGDSGSTANKFSGIGAPPRSQMSSEPSGFLGERDPSFEGPRPTSTSPGGNAMNNGERMSTPDSMPASVPTATNGSPDTSSSTTEPPAKMSDPGSVAMPESKDESGAVEALRMARASAAGRKLDEARQQWKFAEQYATAPDTAVAVQRFGKLLGPLEQFWSSVSAAQQKLKTHDEMTVDGQIVLVVRADDLELGVWVGDRRHTFTPETLPASLAQAVAVRELDAESADGKAALAAFQAFDPQGNRDLARQLWKDAGNDEAELDGVLKEFVATP